MDADWDNTDTEPSLHHIRKFYYSVGSYVISHKLLNFYEELNSLFCKVSITSPKLKDYYRLTMS